MFDNIVRELDEIQAKGVDVNLSFSAGDYVKIALSLFVGVTAAMVLASVITKRI
jgi:hypothetical protein